MAPAENEDKEISQPLFQVHHQESQMDFLYQIPRDNLCQFDTAILLKDPEKSTL